MEFRISLISGLIVNEHSDIFTINFILFLYVQKKHYYTNHRNSAIINTILSKTIHI